MRILLTNDDGIEAEGLECLEKIARTLSDDVWVVAPQTEQSAKGRGITLTEPLRVNKLGDKRFAVTGTPTDCVILAVNDLMPEKPDLVLSGVNRGHNVGEDVSYSGTVAGALQGMAFGIRSIALSQSLERFHDDVVAHWETAEAFAPGIIAKLLEQKWEDGVVMNVNFPNLPPDPPHRPARSRLLLDGLPRRAAGARRGHGPEGDGRGSHLGHAAAYRPDAYAQRQ